METAVNYPNCHAKACTESEPEFFQFIKPVGFHLLQQKFKAIIFLMLIFLLASPAHAQRKMENLGRGTVAVRSSSSQVFVSWRILGLEMNSGVKYNLYRNSTRIASNLNVSNYLDNNSSNSATYSIAAVVNGTEQARSSAVGINTHAEGSNGLACVEVPIRNTPGYWPGLIHVGDLNGDGEYDFVLTKHPDDASQPIYLEAYLNDGTFLWRYNCGPNSVNKYNIEPGSSAIDVGHGDNWTVYDINNNGRAEVIVRTANGSVFGNGAVLNESNNTRQFISVLDGMSGSELGRAAVPTDYLSDGPMNGHMGIAYLDGVNPSVVWSSKNRIGSGAFNMMVTTYNWAGSGLNLNWKWLRTDWSIPDGHNINIIDVDGDGRDEIIPFGFALRPNGTLLWNLGNEGMVHGDRFHISDMDPNRPGLEGYVIQQDNPSTLGWAFYDARTGNVFSNQFMAGVYDMARGIAGDFDPRYQGYEGHTFTDGLYNVSGTRTSTATPGSYPNMRIWWDGDVMSENLDNRKMTKWDYVNQWENRLYTFSDIIQWARNVPGFYGDILGDWREEVVYPAYDRNSLLIFTTVNPTNERIYTLPHNPGYRNTMTTKGYYQSNMVDFYLGAGMSAPPTPNITYGGNNGGGGSGPSYYQLRNRGTGLFLDGMGRTVNGDAAAQYANTTHVNAQWEMISNGSYYQLKNRGTGLFLDGMGRTANGSDVGQWANTTSTNSQWSLQQYSGNYYRLQNRASGLFLDGMGRTANGSAAGQYANTTHVNAQWEMVLVSGSAIASSPSANELEVFENKEISEVKVYPNPSSSEFNIEAAGAFSFTITDQLGRVVEKGKAENSAIAGSTLAPGLYHINVQAEGINKQLKLIRK